MSEDPKDEDLLMRIWENLIRTEEKLKALNAVNDKDHDIIKKDIQTLLEMNKQTDKRLDELEKKRVELDTTWKIIIFLIGAIPTIIAVLDAIGVI